MANSVKVTSKGREVISGRMIGATPTQAEPLNVGWGTGGVGTGSPYAATVNDVNLFGPAAEARTVGVSAQASTVSTNDTYKVTGTITSLSNQTIAEMLLSDSATKPFSTTVVVNGAANVIGSATNTALYTAASYTPANGTYIQLDSEVMQVSTGTGSTALTVVRAQNGTSGISTIAAGDIVVLGNIPGIATANATMFVHGTFTGLSLNTNDSIAFTTSVQVSSS